MTAPIHSGLPTTAALLARADASAPAPELSAAVRPAGAAASSGAAPAIGAPSAPSAAGSDFAQRVADMLRDVSSLQGRADAASEGLVRGDHQDVHGTMIAMQEADIAFRLVTSLRNRAVEAYREIMRMGA